MSYTLNAEEVKKLFHELNKVYDIFAPKRFPGEGRYSDSDMIQYAQITDPSEIEWSQKSSYSAKEVTTPIQETLFYFTEHDYRESTGPLRPRLVFMRPCDINAQRVQDEIFLLNGAEPDYFYQRKRELVHFAMMECYGGDDTCFCVSMGQNKSDNYSIACRFEADGSMSVTVKDRDFQPFFNGYTESDYSFTFVEENELKVTLPDLDDPEVRLRLKSHPMWNEYNKRCISCGACTVACPTCTCFVLRDVTWGENVAVGERRRVAYSCQVPGFDRMAGQKEMRNNAGARMRYKVMHKFHDHYERFGTQQMCIGCGRCTERCPQLITITGAVDKVNAAVTEIKADLKAEAEKLSAGADQK